MFNNKYAGSGSGAKWLLGLSIYFALFIIVVSLVTSLQGGEYYSDIDKSGSFCSNVRLDYYPYSDETTERSTQLALRHLDCSRSRGVLSQDICEEISGCSWESELTGFWFWTSEKNATCIGSMDVSELGILTYQSAFTEGGGYGVKAHNNTPSGRYYGSVCNHPNVLNNQTLCEYFSCIWEDYQPINDINIDSGLSLSMGARAWRTVKQLVTFQYDFGITGTGGFIINLFLFWIPLLGILLSAYVLVRA